ncbi:hypothetical protein UUU_04740 [Klebsiella pneumoniae subsp. pneumoniae DSM 30104 = JCM 1662 = NBRC 14940]|nr:hypothetical protein UUU_04740 [Klebsiella pneumoniae subsp. pneumoniae DSM 30104 = JCM 1662 = NBRC 14940]CDL53357.1 hypothetical protein [Klebsiella pneumoniae ISC21]
MRLAALRQKGEIVILQVINMHNVFSRAGATLVIADNFQ